MTSAILGSSKKWSLPAYVLRTLLLPALVCCWPAQVKLQTENKPAGSTVRGTAVYSDTSRPLRLKVKPVRGGVITGRVVTEDDQPLSIWFALPNRHWATTESPSRLAVYYFPVSAAVRCDTRASLFCGGKQLGNEYSY